jgi:hypothetical protein
MCEPAACEKPLDFFSLNPIDVYLGSMVIATVA